MPRKELTIDLDDAFFAELQRVARELNVSPGQAIEAIIGDLQGSSFQSGITAATADGARLVLTRRSFQVP
jgi:hypothetical protein